METAMFNTANLHLAPYFYLLCMAPLLLFFVLKAMVETTPHQSTNNFKGMDAKGAQNPGSFQSDHQDKGHLGATRKGTQSS